MKPSEQPITDHQRQLIEELARLTHAVQTGVLAEMNMTPSGPAIKDPKHLRTGINLAMASVSGLGKLLIDKGLITGDEYYEYMVEAYRREVENCEQRVFNATGNKIKFL